MNDDGWFSSLYEENYALLYRVGRVFLGGAPAQADWIEDSIQETFVLAWKHEEKLRTHPNPAGWLVETLRHRLMKQCRKLGREGTRRAFSFNQEDRPDMADEAAPSAESFVRGEEQLALLRRLLGERDAELFLRYCVQGETAKALAREFELSESGVRVRVSRLKRKLLQNRELFLCVVALLALGRDAGGAL